jgi:hypothetical protein
MSSFSVSITFLNKSDQAKNNIKTLGNVLDSKYKGKVNCSVNIMKPQLNNKDQFFLENDQFDPVFFNLAWYSKISILALSV